MKKNILSLAALLAIGTMAAQVRIVNNATNLSVTNSPAFIDASSNTTVNNSTNIGKGILFPRVDLTTMTAFQTGLVTGIPNSFPTRFDGLIVYNTASSGTAGIGSTSGTLTPGYWYYENKSATNTGGTWKPLTGTASGGDNLGNHTATQDLAMNGNAIRLKTSDTNNELVYNATVDGPRLFGNAGGYLGTVNGTNALTWDSSGNVISPGVIRSGNVGLGSISLNPGNTLGSGFLGYYAANGTRAGYIQAANAAINYTAENGYYHNFSGIIYSDNYIRSGASGSGYIAMVPGSSSASGYLGYYATDGTRAGFIQAENGAINYKAENNYYHNFSGIIYSDNYIRSGAPGSGYIALGPGGPLSSGYLGYYAANGTRAGYIQVVNGKINYTADSGYTHDFNGDLYAENQVYSGINQWFRVRGSNSGIVWEDHGGGWYMNDNTWIRAYNGKNIYTPGIIQADTFIQTPRVQGPSDRRFKKDITPIIDATAKLNLLNGYTYTWRDKKEFPGQALGVGKDMGVIAQEVEKVFPDAVMTNKEGYKSVNYNALIPVLIEALKETNNRVHVLEAQLDKMQQAVTHATVAELKRK